MSYSDGSSSVFPGRVEDLRGPDAPKKTPVYNAAVKKEQPAKNSSNPGELKPIPPLHRLVPGNASVGDYRLNHRDATVRFIADRYRRWQRRRVSTR
jgi:hypothetical protein